jgi:hypothetical protein
MANICFNRLRILGPQSAVVAAFDRIKAAIIDPDDQDLAMLDFSKLFPLPSPNVDEQGFWGTSSPYSGVRDIEPPEASDNGFETTEDGFEGSIHFFTRITPARGVIEKLSGQFPTASFVLGYENENDELRGILAFQSGEVKYQRSIRPADVNLEDEAEEGALDEALNDLMGESEDKAVEALLLHKEAYTTVETFLGLCRKMAEAAGVTVEVNEKEILFSGIVKNVDLRYSLPEGLVSVRPREYCPGYDGSPDARWFIVETIQDHIEIAQGAHREGPDWREVLDRMPQCDED